MLRSIPPAGTPLEVPEILHAWRSSLSANGRGADHLTILARRLGVRHILGAGSGRAALWLLLQALHRLRPERAIVALPAYTCFSVAAAAVRAGLKLFPLEVNPEKLDCDFSGLDALPKESLLCVITSHLFGVVNDVSVAREKARQAGAFLIDNAAQALGAERDGYLAGTGGDAGIYSFGRGKALSALEGGAVVTNDDRVARALREEARELPDSSRLHSVQLFLELLAYSAFLRPRLYWVPNGLPFLNLGVTRFDPGFPVHSLPPLSRELIVNLLDRLDEVSRVRRANATRIVAALEGNRSVCFPRWPQDCRPAMVRLPVIARDEQMRQLALCRLTQAGIGASGFYPSAICDIPGIGAHMVNPSIHRKQAERLSRTLFTLPVHSYVERGDIERMIEILRSL